MWKCVCIMGEGYDDTCSWGALFCSYCNDTSVYIVRGVHNKIHNIKKPSEALPSQVFQVVAKVIKGHISF